MKKQATVFDYVVEIKSNNFKYATHIGILMLIFVMTVTVIQNLILTPTKQIVTLSFMNFYIWLIIVIVSLGMAYYNYYKGERFLIGRSVAIAGFMWISVPKMEWLIIPFIAAYFLEKFTKTSPEYGFDEYGIVYNSFPEKNYDWEDVQNVVIKFGMLSIDLKNNHLIQAEVNEEINLNLENEFNTYCKKKLEFFNPIS